MNNTSNIIAMCIRLVVARYTENLQWLSDVPSNIDEIIVYNKSPIEGPTENSLQPSRYRTRMMHWSLRSSSSSRDKTDLSDQSILPECVQDRARVVQLRNVGREADTYLQHIIDHYDTGLADVTIFSQGDPFEHSPDFIHLLGAEAVAQYDEPVQPLTDRWKVQVDIPPANVLERYPGKMWHRLKSYRSSDRDAIVHTCAHPMSVHTLDLLRFHDPGANNIRQHYMRENNLVEGDDIIAHLLQYHGRCKKDVCNQYIEDMGITHLCFGAVFAVTQQGIKRHEKKTYERLRAYNLQTPFGPYMLERAWMSLFGYAPTQPNTTVST